MAEQRELSGTLSRNKKREHDHQPEYRGSATIDGMAYWLSAWVKESDDGKFFSLSLKRKDDQPAQTKPSVPAPAAPKHLDGNNANPRGRPKGSRNKISEEFISALCDDFEQHGVEVIEAVRTQRPADYLKIIASIVPKELNVSTSSLEDLSDDDLSDILDTVRTLMAGMGKPHKTKPLAN